MMTGKFPDDAGAAPAAEAMDAVAQARARLGQTARWSVPRHAAFGLIMGTLVASLSLPGAWPVAVIALCALATSAIVRTDRRRDGMFINGYRRGATLWVTAAILLVSFAGLGVGLYLRHGYGLAWGPVAAGIVVAILCAAGSKLWERAYQRELGGRGD